MIESSRSHGAFEEAYLGPLKLRNRVIKAATFEGMTDGNTVHPKLIEFHRRMAAGGVGLSLGDQYLKPGPRQWPLVLSLSSKDPIGAC